MDSPEDLLSQLDAISIYIARTWIDFDVASDRDKLRGLLNQQARLNELLRARLKGPVARKTNKRYGGGQYTQ